MFFHLTNNMCLQCGESSVNQIASMNENDSLKRFVHQITWRNTILSKKKKKKFPSVGYT